MLFHSLHYLLFFALVFAVYWSLPWQQGRIYLLLAASLFFYACWSEALALLVVATTLVDYLNGLALAATARTGWRRALLTGSLLMNLGLLGYFKYANFFLDSLRHGMSAAGEETFLPSLEVILPLGISFYTFEAISYTIDVYQGRIAAERDLARFMLFILFFPHLIAGPIVRARDFLIQAARPKRFSWVRLQYGVQLFLIGLFKKIAIADRMAVYCDPVFRDPQHYHTSAVWFAVLAYAVRIYGDFSGYSDMALGSAHLLGYKLNLNFRMPYLALNVTEFWRRWHISLSAWLRDYLFISLGGSRGSAWQAGRNLMLTLTLAGLWHGANWSYVLWGVLHGALLVTHRLFRAGCARQPWLQGLLETIPGKLLRGLATFFCVMLCWVFFQPSLETAWMLLAQMFSAQPGARLAMPKHSLLVLLAALLLVEYLALRGWGKWLIRRLPAPATGLAYALLLALALLLAPDRRQAFLYFQF